MRKRIINLPQFDSEDAGVNNICALKTGKVRYHNALITLRHGAGAGALMTQAEMIVHVKEIVIKLNEGQIWRIKPEKYFAIEKANDKDFVVEDGELVLNFSNRKLKEILAQEATAIGTLGLSNFTIELELDATVINPKLNGVAEVDDILEEPQLVRHLRYKPWNVTSVGVYQKDVRGRAASFKALHLFEGAAGDVANIRINYEDKYLCDCAPARIKTLNKPYGFFAEAGHIHLSFDKGGLLSDALVSQVPMANGQSRDASLDFDLDMVNANDLILVEDFYSAPKKAS